jgi:hypothetical protein
MKHRTKELLLAFALWVPGLVAYASSLGLPWFNLDQGAHTRITRKTVSRTDRDQSQTVITGMDSFDFLFERLRGGSFVWLAHPLVWIGWLLLVCRRWRAATIAGCLALVLALNVSLVFQPREGPWLPPGPGYYLWFTSMALLACSAFLRNRFFASDPAADSESLRRLAGQQRTFATELAELKQQVAGLVDHQAADFLVEAEGRKTSEFSDL